MAQKTDFTEQEWDTLHKGVTGAGLLVALSDRSFFDTFKEAGALAKHVAGGRSSSSGVVQDLAQERGTGFGMIGKPDEIERETLDALRSAVTALKTKAPGELDAYRRFVLEVAQSVGAAAGGGEQAEQDAIGKIRSGLAGNGAAGGEASVGV